MPAAHRLAAPALVVGLAASACSAIVASDLADKPTAAEVAGAGGSTTAVDAGASSGGGGSGGAPTTTTTTTSDAGGTTTSTSAGGAGGGCASPTTDCDGACVDLATDPGHCGACGAACQNAHGSTACVGGACHPTCDPGFDTCGGAPAAGCAVELATSAEHCGACETACDPGRSCAAGACVLGWLAIPAPAFPFSGRVKAAGAWLGDGLFVWGGNEGAAAASNGALFDAAAGTWVEVPGAGAPSARCLAAAVATGPSVVVWGGGSCASPEGPAFAGGARYERATGTWTPVATNGAPTPRLAPMAAWTGAEVIVWGGTDGGKPVAGGALYDDAKDSWRAMSPGGAPAPRLDAGWAFGGGTLFVIGGRVDATVTGDAYAYDVGEDAWRTLAGSGAPSPRTSPFVAWTGSGLVVHGGLDPQGVALADGARWDAATDTWAALAAAPARAAVAGRTGWSGAGAHGVVIAGGWDGAKPLADAHVLAPDGVAWAAAGSFPSGATHEWGVGVWTGTEIVLWGGLSGGGLVTTGERFAP